LNLYNNEWAGIQSIENSSNLVFNNLNIHNNYHGLYLDHNQDVTINNSKIYNNHSNKVHYTDYSSINNSLIFNNESFLYFKESDKFLINNSMIFNTADHGLILDGSNVLLAKNYIFNNRRLWVGLDSSTIQYRDNNYVFGNGDWPFESISGITSRPAKPSLSWGAGVMYDDWGYFNPIQFGMSWNYLVNVKNNTDAYLLSRMPHHYPSLAWVKDFSLKFPLDYSYGQNIPAQSIPAIFSGGANDFVPGLSYNPNHYIWSNINRYTWVLEMPEFISGYNVTVTWIANPTQVNKYNIFDSTFLTQNYLWNTINNPVNITFIEDWEKKIITQIENTNTNYYATHFENETYVDSTPPNFTFSNGAWAECVQWFLQITNASDYWVWLHTLPYSFDGYSRSTNSIITIPAQQPWTVSKTAYVRDKLYNIANRTATYTFTNTMPTANDFTGHTNVWSGTQTANWLISSNATDGACGSWDISFVSIITQWTKWSCSVDWNNISYTPNIGYTWTDSCVIRIKDNENNNLNITVYREWIDYLRLDPIIFFTGVNPVDNFTLNQTRFTTQIQIEQTEEMEKFNYNFDWTVHNVYDSGLILMYNFDNISALGETNTIIKDLSMSWNHAIWYGWITRTWNGQWWWAYSFDWSNDYIKLQSGIEFKTWYSLSMFIDFTNTNDVQYFIWTMWAHKWIRYNWTDFLVFNWNYNGYESVVWTKQNKIVHFVVVRIDTRYYDIYIDW